MSDEPFYTPNRKPDPPRQPKSGEHLWTFIRSTSRQRAEPRDFSEGGAELQFLRDDQFVHGHRCETRAFALLQAQAIAEA